MEAVTIGLELEEDRLEHRLRRVELVTTALRDRALHQQALSGGSHSPLREAIAGFELELSALRRRLTEIRRARAAS